MYAQASTSLQAEILNSVPADALLKRLQEYRRGGGPRTYSLKAYWRAFMLKHLLNIPSISELHRRFQSDPRLLKRCGFLELPDRSSFSRFFTRVSQHEDLLDVALIELTERLKAQFSDLGETVAVDATVIKAWDNPHRRSKITGRKHSDPEAGWTASISKQDPRKRDFTWGYKLHMMVDAIHQIPLYGYVTPANTHETRTLPQMLEKAQARHSWFKPKYVLADRGYDSKANHEAVQNIDAAFICPMIERKRSDKAKQQSEFDSRGSPYCSQGSLMQYQTTLPNGKHYFRCPVQGQHPDNKMCQVHELIDWRTQSDKKLHGAVFRGSRRWHNLYEQRQSVERVFKSMQEARTLDKHRFRGLTRVSVHAKLSMLTYMATVLVKVENGLPDTNWMVDRVA